MTVDGTGNVVIADWFNSRVRVVAASAGTFYGRAMTAGDIYTIAGTGTRGFSGDGGPATAAKLYAPRGPALDGAGNLVFADNGNNRVRVVAASTGTFYGKAMTAGDIYTVAGNGAMGLSGDGGPATAAALASPVSIAVDGGGNLLIADAANNRCERSPVKATRQDQRRPRVIVSARDGLAHPIGSPVQCAGLLPSSRMWPNTSATLMAGCAPNSEM